MPCWRTLPPARRAARTSASGVAPSLVRGRYQGHTSELAPAGGPSNPVHEPDYLVDRRAQGFGSEVGGGAEVQHVGIQGDPHPGGVVQDSLRQLLGPRIVTCLSGPPDLPEGVNVLPLYPKLDETAEGPRIVPRSPESEVVIASWLDAG